MPGGIVLQRLMTEALNADEELIERLQGAALDELQRRAKHKAAEALAAVNQQRMRLGLPPIGDVDDRLSAEIDFSAEGAPPPPDGQPPQAAPPAPYSRRARRPANPQESQS